MESSAIWCMLGHIFTEPVQENDTYRQLEKVQIKYNRQFKAGSVRSFFSSMCRKVETDTSEKLPNHFKNHLQQSATLRTSSQVSVQYSPSLCRRTIPNRHPQDISKINISNIETRLAKSVWICVSPSLCRKTIPNGHLQKSFRRGMLGSVREKRLEPVGGNGI